MDAVDWNDLKVVRAVAAAGSLRAAGERLGCSHATVSRRLRALEQATGGPPLEQRDGRWAPTELGERLLDAAAVLDRELDAIADAQGGPAGLVGPVRLGGPEVLLAWLVPDLAGFVQRHPGLELELEPVEHADASTPDVRVALHPHGEPPPGPRPGTPLGRVAVAAYATRRWLDQHGGGPDSSTATRIEARATPALPLPRRHRAGSLHLAAAAARAGLGAAILPCILGDPDPALERLPSRAPTRPWDIWLQTSDAVAHTARVRALRSWLAATLARRAPDLQGTPGDGPGENLR